MLTPSRRESLLSSVVKQKSMGVVRYAAGPVVGLCVLMLAGCGNTYRPVVSAINPVGPASQPAKYAVVVSDPGQGRQGIVTIVDVFGDTLIANANVAPAPAYFALDSSSTGFVLHKGTTTACGVPINSELLDSFPVRTTLMTNLVTQASLLGGSNPTSIFPGAGTSALFITEPGSSRVAALTNAAPPTLRQELRIPANPVYTIGRDNAARVYVLSQSSVPGWVSPRYCGHGNGDRERAKPDDLEYDPGGYQPDLRCSEPGHAARLCAEPGW